MKLEDLQKLNQESGVYQARDQQRLQEYLRSAGIQQGNLYQELEMASRFVDTHRDSSSSNTSVSLHSHTFYEVLCCRNTCNVEYLVGADRYRLQKGDIVIVPPGVSHRPLLPEYMPEPYNRDVIWISTEFLTVMQTLFADRDLYEATDTRLIRTAGTRWEFLMDKIHQGVVEAEQKDVGWEAAVAANTAQLLIQIRRAIIERTANPLRAEKPQLLDQVLAYVEQHLSERITLPEIAHHFYVSESTVSQIFRKKMGISFYRCVTQRRLIAAKSLIEEGLLLENVGQQVGFADYSSFYRAFRQEYGISPRQYRKILLSNEQGNNMN